jgi:hypothetical protein
MKIGVCGIACEKCPRMVKGTCPNGKKGCVARENNFCTVANCAFNRGVKYCFDCSKFPCELTKSSPINYGFCKFISERKY